jgi:hypothetical protein
MVICNPRLQSTQNQCIYNNYNIYWFSKPIITYLTFIWYLLIWRWNDFTYSTSWSSFIMLNKELSNQSICIPHVEPIEPIATPTFVWQGGIYPQCTWPLISIFGLGERSQVPQSNFKKKPRCWNCNMFILLSNGTHVQLLPICWW